MPWMWWRSIRSCWVMRRKDDNVTMTRTAEARRESSFVRRASVFGIRRGPWMSGPAWIALPSPDEVVYVYLFVGVCETMAATYT
mmetsp:Transcript_1073/g.3027  ORF Transcript_1073/g.3027 Transcript_1073/m.3027 type:complete len:84 (+) Transcript_1073:327-578(+)